MPIQGFVKAIAITKERPPTRWQRLIARMKRVDPVLALGLALLISCATWAAAPLARSVSKTSDTTINFNVPNSTSVVPGFTGGDTSVELPAQTVPGEAKTASSNGWKLATNWANGYAVTLRASSDPALRARNARGGSAVRAYFDDFETSGCPCPWKAEGERGVFGYSVELATDGGTAADASKWGTASARKWRGFTQSGYQVFQTPGGTGQYTMNLRFRTEIPIAGTQPAGAYRANLVAAIVPLL